MSWHQPHPQGISEQCPWCKQEPALRRVLQSTKPQLMLLVALAACWKPRLSPLKAGWVQLTASKPPSPVPSLLPAGHNLCFHLSQVGAGPLHPVLEQGEGRSNSPPQACALLQGYKAGRDPLGRTVLDKSELLLL